MNIFVWRGVLEFTVFEDGKFVRGHNGPPCPLDVYALGRTAAEAKNALISVGVSKSHWKGCKLCGVSPVKRPLDCGIL